MDEQFVGRCRMYSRTGIPEEVGRMLRSRANRAIKPKVLITSLCTPSYPILYPIIHPTTFYTSHPTYRTLTYIYHVLHQIVHPLQPLSYTGLFSHPTLSYILLRPPAIITHHTMYPVLPHPTIPYRGRTGEHKVGWLGRRRLQQDGGTIQCMQDVVGCMTGYNKVGWLDNPVQSYIIVHPTFHCSSILLYAPPSQDGRA